MLSNVDNVERWSRRFAVGRVAVKKSGREYVRYNVSNESVQTEMKNVEQVHAGNKAAFEAVKVESVVRNGLVADSARRDRTRCSCAAHALLMRCSCAARNLLFCSEPAA